MKQNNIRPETSPHSEQATQPCQTPDPINRGIGVPVHHFGDENGVQASVIKWSDGNLFLRITGKNIPIREINFPTSADPL